LQWEVDVSTDQQNLQIYMDCNDLMGAMPNYVLTTLTSCTSPLCTHNKEHAEMVLQCGKHVLVEKTMSSADAQYLYDLGRALNLFVGEGMWTRFFPAVEYVR
jgi:hypothetical protein